MALKCSWPAMSHSCEEGRGTLKDYVIYMDWGGGFNGLKKRGIEGIDENIQIHCLFGGN